ncbi:MAG: hypothetical protein ACKV2T_09110 [Kofleriaceae bacterium]
MSNPPFLGRISGLILSAGLAACASATGYGDLPDDPPPDGPDAAILSEDGSFVFDDAAGDVQPMDAAPPDPFASSTAITTTGGSCSTQIVRPYSCYPGTPGRDWNGCCIENAYLSQVSTLTFEMSVLADGRRELAVSDCTLGHLPHNIAVCDVSATASEANVGDPLKNPAVSLKSTNYFPYVGPLTGTIANGTLTIAYTSVAPDFGERCGNATHYRSCTWTWTP